jgi:restriction system protein
VAVLLRESGYEDVRVVGGARDLAADIVAHQDGERVVVQCKRFSAGTPVTSQMVQLFIGMIHVHHKADRGIYVTTGRYTADARALGLRHGIELVDGQTLATWNA